MNIIQEINEHKIVIRRMTDNKVAKIDIKYSYEGMRVGDEVEIERTADGGIILNRVEKTFFFEDSKTESLLKQEPSGKEHLDTEPIKVSVGDLKEELAPNINEENNIGISKEVIVPLKIRNSWFHYLVVFIVVFGISLFSIPWVESVFSAENKAYNLFISYMKNIYSPEEISDFKLRLAKKDVLIVDMRGYNQIIGSFNADYLIVYYSSLYESTRTCSIYLNKPISEQCD